MSAARHIASLMAEAIYLSGSGPAPNFQAGSRFACGIGKAKRVVRQKFELELFAFREQESLLCRLAMFAASTPGLSLDARRKRKLERAAA